MAYRLIPVVLPVVVLLVACGEAAGTSGAAGSEPPAPAAESGLVSCGGATYDPAELADAPPASTLPEGPAGAVDDIGKPAFDPSQDWKVVAQSDDRVDLIRKLAKPAVIAPGDVRTHHAITLERVTGATNVVDGTWMLMSDSPCTQRLIAGGNLGEADVTLARTPSPEDTAIDLLVHERACASGQSAEGRIELIELTETARQVQLRIGVRPPTGDAQTCQSNPPTAYSVELAEPVGDRRIVDASVVPARPVTLDSGP